MSDNFNDWASRLEDSGQGPFSKAALTLARFAWDAARKDLIESIRQALADYIASEGCSCCRYIEKHDEAAKRLASLLDVPPYDDGSGYQFHKFRSKE
jgi:hypothetical protein